MCVNPLKIRNPKLHPNYLYDPKELFVPCGHCRECSDSQIGDWVTRLVAEFEQTRLMHGYTFYYTLTYNNQNLPRFQGRPCFDKPLMQRFLKRLRKNLFGSDFSSLKYFISSEFGGELGRPHHHCLFFLGKKVDPYRFRKAVTSSWIFGFNKPGDNLGLVQTVHAVKYVSKYVCKDLEGDSSFHKFLCDHSFDCLHFLDQNDINHDGTFRDVIRKCRNRFGRFTLSSNYLGISLLSHLTDVDLTENRCNIEDPLSGRKRVSIPTYIKRKLYYETYINSNGNVSFRLNFKGIQRAVKDYERKYKAFSDTFDNLLQNVPSLLHQVNQSDLIEDLSSFNNNFAFRSMPDHYRRLLFDYKLYRNGLVTSPKLNGQDLVFLRYPVHPEYLYGLYDKRFYKGSQELFDKKFRYISEVFDHASRAIRYLAYVDRTKRQNALNNCYASIRHGKVKTRPILSYHDYCQT